MSSMSGDPAMNPDPNMPGPQHHHHHHNPAMGLCGTWTCGATQTEECPPCAGGDPAAGSGDPAAPNMPGPYCPPGQFECAAPPMMPPMGACSHNAICPHYDPPPACDTMG